MKILLIHNFYRYRGGEDHYVQILDDTFSQKGHQVSCLFYDSKDIKDFNPFRKLLIPFKFIRSKRVNRRLEQLIRDNKPDLAVIHNMFPLISLSILKVLKRFGIPVIKRIENFRFLCLNGLFLRSGFGICEVCSQGNYLPGIIHKCYQNSFFNSLGMSIPLFFGKWKKKLFSSVNTFLIPSIFVKERFQQIGFPEKQLRILPNFLDSEPVDTTSQPDNYAVFMGRLSVEKGLHTLLKAFKELPHVPLKILGAGPIKEELEGFVIKNHLKQVEFVGYVDGQKKKEILAKALFLIFPSECYESFGYSIIESYACGVPVVASALGGAKELVEEGETGYLFEAGNHEDLMDKINRIREDKDQMMKMRKRALERVKRLYTKEIGYDNLIKLFSELT
jgi:glycosyltransferase involved in cell wall biosynthesis